MQELQNTEKQPSPPCKTCYDLLIIFGNKTLKLDALTYFLYILYTPLFNFIFTHLDVPIHTTHKRTSTKDWLQDNRPWSGQPIVPELHAVQAWLPHWGMLRGWQMQIPCYEKAEVSRGSWGQICHVVLESSCVLSSAPSYNTEVKYSRNALLLQTPEWVPVCPQLCRLSITGLWAPNITEVWVCSLQGCEGYLPI